MQKYKILIIVVLALLLLFGCVNSNPKPSDGGYVSFTDDLGRRVELYSKPKKVIALMGSYGELWQLSGGELTGVTEDALSERNMNLGDDVKIIGSVKEPNIELILSLDPDFVILSTDITSHVNLEETLNNALIPHAYFKVDTFDEYLNKLKICTDINDTPKNYKIYGEDLKKEINNIIKKANKQEKSKILLIRSMATKAKALKEDHLVGSMLADLNTENIASKHTSLLEDLSLEIIINENPDFIFVITMGDEKKAMETIENTLLKNPAFSELDAVKNDKFFILPKELFQYKPNDKYLESYEYLEKILYEK